jgi:hypothetical protein
MRSAGMGPIGDDICCEQLTHRRAIAFNGAADTNDAIEFPEKLDGVVAYDRGH